METRVKFSINGKQYILFIEKRIPKGKLALFQCYEGSVFLNPIPIKISTSTLGEVIGYWLIMLKLYLVKKRNKQRSQNRCGNSRNTTLVKKIAGKELENGISIYRGTEERD